VNTVDDPAVRSAVREVDDLLEQLFEKHFGKCPDRTTRWDYLEATHRFATDMLPAASERAALVPDHDFRKRTAGRHTLDSDLMWFCWALHVEAAALLERGGSAARHALMMAGIATGCAANFTWRGHRRTRSEYSADERTVLKLRGLGMEWATDFTAARSEVHTLYRIREWGHI